MASGTAASVKLCATGLQRPKLLTLKIELMSGRRPLGSCSRPAGWSAATSCIGTNRRLEVGQSMSALPGYFRHQLVPLLPKHHLPRCRDI